MADEVGLRRFGVLLHATQALAPGKRCRRHRPPCTVRVCTEEVERLAVYDEQLGRRHSGPLAAARRGGVWWGVDRRRARPLSADDRAGFLNANAALASDGQRVLGVAFCPLADPDPALTDGQLIFLGLIAMLDPPRPEAQRAVQSCVTAGIRPIMITGDHPLTVSAAARHLGIGGVRV